MAYPTVMNKRIFYGFLISMYISIGITTEVLAISRDAIIRRAKEYADFKWTCKSGNANSTYNKWVVGKTYGPNPSVPYNYGGRDTLERAKEKLDAGVVAGNTHTEWIKRIFAGVDCSGFVSRCWRVHHWDVVEFIDTNTKIIPWQDLKKGDIVHWSKNHVRLFDSYTTDTNQIKVYESTVNAIDGNDDDGVFYRPVPRGNYTPRRYNKLLTTDNVSSTKFQAGNTVKVILSELDLRSTPDMPNDTGQEPGIPKNNDCNNVWSFANLWCH